MAKLSKKQKVKRVTTKVTGCSEPKIESLKLGHQDYSKELSNSNFYLRTQVNNKELKTEMIKWIKKNKKIKTDKYLSLEDWRFMIAGKYCYLLNRGAELEENILTYIETKYQEITEIADKQVKIKKLEEEQKKKTPTKSVQDYLREHANLISGEYFEPWFDEFMKSPKTFKAKNYDPLTIMRTEELKQGHVRYIIKSYEDQVIELSGVVDGSAEDGVIEAYEHYSTAQVKECLSLYESIISACNMILKTAKATRKTRSKKIQLPTKLVEKLKVGTEDVRTGIVSVELSTIIGAKEVWFYNTKARKLGKFVSLDDTGLGVKGASIVDFSLEKSMQKTLRKPPEQMKKFHNAKTREMNKEFNDIKGMTTQVKGKVNDNFVIFKVFK